MWRGTGIGETYQIVASIISLVISPEALESILLELSCASACSTRQAAGRSPIMTSSAPPSSSHHVTSHHLPSHHRSDTSLSTRILIIAKAQPIWAERTKTRITHRESCAIPASRFLEVLHSAALWPCYWLLLVINDVVGMTSSHRPVTELAFPARA